MHFFEQSKRMAAEFLKFRKYKNMAPAMAVFTGIFLIPFALGFFLGLGILFLCCILFYLVESPLHYLHTVVKTEGKETHPATCFIIYFISWPLLFFLYAVYACLTFFIHLFYVLTMLCGYIASLAGFKFHITPNEENIALEGEPAKPFTIRALVYVLICAALLLILIVIGVVKYNDLYSRYMERYFMAEFMGPANVISILYQLFTFIYVPIAFRFKKSEPLPKPEPEPSDKK